jgi:hypothetical protein
MQQQCLQTRIGCQNGPSPSEEIPDPQLNPAVIPFFPACGKMHAGEDRGRGSSRKPFSTGHHLLLKEMRHTLYCLVENVMRQYHSGNQSCDCKKNFQQSH